MATVLIPLIGLISLLGCRAEYCLEYSKSDPKQVTRSLSCIDGCCGHVNERMCCDNYYQITTRIGIIVGCVVGGILFICFVVSIIVCCVCKCIHKNGQRGGVVNPARENTAIPMQQMYVPSAIMMVGVPMQNGHMNGPPPAYPGNSYQEHLPPQYSSIRTSDMAQGDLYPTKH